MDCPQDCKKLRILLSPIETTSAQHDSITAPIQGKPCPARVLEAHGGSSARVDVPSADGCKSPSVATGMHYKRGFLSFPRQRKRRTARREKLACRLPWSSNIAVRTGCSGRP